MSSKGRAWARMVGHDTAGWATIQPTTRPREATTQSLVRARGMAGGLCCDTQFCIMTEARDWPLGVVSRYNLCIVTGGQSGLRACHDTIACIVIGGKRLGCWAFRETGHHTSGQACDTVRHSATCLRHCRCWACDTAHCMPRHGAVRALSGHSERGLGAPCA